MIIYVKNEQKSIPVTFPVEREKFNHMGILNPVTVSWDGKLQNGCSFQHFDLEGIQLPEGLDMVNEISRFLNGLDMEEACIADSILEKRGKDFESFSIEFKVLKTLIEGIRTNKDLIIPEILPVETPDLWALGLYLEIMRDPKFGETQRYYLCNGGIDFKRIGKRFVIKEDAVYNTAYKAWIVPHGYFDIKTTDEEVEANNEYWDL